MCIGHKLSDTLLEFGGYVVRNQVILFQVGPPKLPCAFSRLKSERFPADTFGHNLGQKHSKVRLVLAFVFGRWAQVARQRLVSS